MVNPARLVAGVGAVYATTYGVLFATLSWDAVRADPQNLLVLLSLLPLCGLPLVLAVRTVRPRFTTALAVVLGVVQYVWWHAVLPGRYSGVLLLPVVVLAGLALFLFVRGPRRRVGLATSV